MLTLAPSLILLVTKVVDNRDTELPIALIFIVFLLVFAILKYASTNNVYCVPYNVFVERKIN